MSHQAYRAEVLGHEWVYPQPLGPDGLPSEASGYVGFEPGITKRQLFAAMAMQGLLAGDTDRVVTADGIAKEAVEQADALLAELAKPVEGGQA